MVRLQRFLTAATLLLLALVVSDAKGQSDDEFDTGDKVLSVPRYQIGFGLGYRIDEADEETLTPSFQGRFFRYFSSELALVGTLEFNNLTRIKNGTSFRTAALGVGIRAEPPVRKLLPMVELGFWFPYYWGTYRGWDIHDWGPGLRVGAGYRLGLGRGLVCEVNLSQILNHVRTDYTVASPSADAPCPPGVDCDYDYSHRGSPPDGAYNATAVELLLRLAL